MKKEDIVFNEEFLHKIKYALQLLGLDAFPSSAKELSDARLAKLHAIKIENPSSLTILLEQDKQTSRIQKAYNFLRENYDASQKLLHREKPTSTTP